MEMQYGAFGCPPAELLEVRAGALQFSPLFPGASRLESCEPASLAGINMLAPPGTIERRYALALSLRALSPSAELSVAAPKDKGGSRLKKELLALGCEVEEEAKSHHRICICRAPASIDSLSAAIAEGAPRFLEETGFWTQPGVFSWNRIDPGSMLLVEQLPSLTGMGADLGCGVGYLSREILKNEMVKHLTLFEIDRRAVECARKNLDAERVTIHWADVRTTPMAAAAFDFVVTNPPFHDGGTEDQSLGQDFLRRAHEALKPGGSCWLVANRHLPYETLLRALFREVVLKSETSGFKIYEAKK